MSQDIAELYDQALKTLAAPERFELASMLLQSIPPQSVVDYSEEWTDEDVRELSAHCRNRAAEVMDTDEQSPSS